MKTIDMGNGERISIGIFPLTSGGFIACTPSASKSFRTRKGAEGWLSRRGYNADGSRKEG